MCFDIRVVTCGPNEALVISGKKFFVKTSFWIFFVLYVKIESDKGKIACALTFNDVNE